MKTACDPERPFEFARTEPPIVADSKLLAGTWFYNETGAAPSIVCPECGRHVGRLSKHVIREDGLVLPSIVCGLTWCGDGVKRCDAHYYGKLNGWKGPR